MSRVEPADSMRASVSALASITCAQLRRTLARSRGGWSAQPLVLKALAALVTARSTVASEAS